MGNPNTASLGGRMQLSGLRRGNRWRCLGLPEPTDRLPSDRPRSHAEPKGLGILFTKPPPWLPDSHSGTSGPVEFRAQLLASYLSITWRYLAITWQLLQG